MKVRLLQHKFCRVILFAACLCALLAAAASAQADSSEPPNAPVKLIFIHHSCGQNWLTDGHGDLGLALAENNYFVSDTNYGWGPDSIGDRTDILDWPEWFTGRNSSRYLEALYTESGQHSEYTRTLADPGGENEIVLFKSCFPNSNLAGSPDDRPRRGRGLTVANAKAIYNELLDYFASRPHKLFVAVTAPPLLDETHASNARAFNTWLVTEWLADYEGSNVAVFDFYNVLTGPNNHHRFINGSVEYVTDRGGDTLYYDSDGDPHPNPTGNQKATAELLPLLNVYYHRWRRGATTAATGASVTSSEPGPAADGATSGAAGRPEEPTESADPTGSRGLCPGSVVLGFAVIGIVATGGRRRSTDAI